MLHYVTIVFAALFGLKIFWNLGVPYDAASRCYRGKRSESAGISLMPHLEVLLLGIIAVLSLFEHGALWSWTVGTTLLVGGAIIVASYIHMFVASFLIGWIVSMFRKQPPR